MCYWFTRLVAIVITKVWFRLKVYGRDRVPWDAGAVLLAANHTSFADPVVVGAACPHRVWFMAKEELLKVRGLGRLIQGLGIIPVSREMSDTEALRQALRYLHRGSTVGIFPEGTRRDAGDHGSPLSGVGLLAHRSGCPVVPVYIHGMERSWPKQVRWPRPARVEVYFGMPLTAKLPPSISGRRAVYEEVSEQVMAGIHDLREQVCGGPVANQHEVPL